MPVGVVKESKAVVDLIGGQVGGEPHGATEIAAVAAAYAY